MNNGPGSGERIAKYCISAVTGQMSEPVVPTKISTPSRNGSVLLCLICRQTRDGAVWLSIAMSARLRWTSGSWAEGDGTVNSPARRNPKNLMQAEAHSIVPSVESVDVCQIAFSFDRMSKVIGRQGFVVTPACA